MWYVVQVVGVLEAPFDGIYVSVAIQVGCPLLLHFLVGLAGEILVCEPLVAKTLATTLLQVVE